MDSVRICFFRADFADNFGVGDLVASVERDVVIVNDVEGVCALDSFVGTRIVGADALAESAEFVCIGFAPYRAKFRVSAELFVIEGQTRIVVEDRCGEFGWSEDCGTLTAGG